MAHGQAGAEIAFGHGPTLTCNHEAPIVAFDCKGSQVQHVESGATPTLRAMGHAASHANAGGQLAVAFAQNQRDEVRIMDVAGALASEPGMKQQTFLAFDCLAGGETALSVGDVPGALHGGGKSGGRAAVAFDLRGREGGALPEGPHETANLRAASGGSSRSYVAEPWAVRRLTPRECERLQGFPDDFTRIPWGARKRIEAHDLLYIRLTNPSLSMDEARSLAADGPRYKALGNSWAVNCAEWIGERIEAVEALAEFRQCAREQESRNGPEL